MWITRDKDGMLCIQSHKPSKGKKIWIKKPKDKSICVDSICIIPEHWFPEVKWEDEEPRELVLKPIKKE